MTENKLKIKETHSNFVMVKTKETEEEEKVYTFIGASTLPDRVREQLPDGKVIEGEIFAKKVLDKMGGFINDNTKHGGKYGSYRTISLFHDRVNYGDMKLEEAGYVLPNSARVKELVGIEGLEKDYPGEYGLLVDVKTNKMYTPSDKYNDYTPDKINYKIENNAIGLSVEYNNTKEQEKLVSTDQGTFRFINDTDDFRGFGFARSNVIGNPSAVRVKEIYDEISTKTKESEKQMDEKDTQELSDANAKIKELQNKLSAAETIGADAKQKEISEEMKNIIAKVKEIELKNDESASKIKESIELAFTNLNFNTPAKSEESNESAKIKEIYSNIETRDWTKFKEASSERISSDKETFAKFKEQFAIDGAGFNFEKNQTLSVKCKGSDFIVVPSAKTKDVIDSGSMSESTYYQTNAMFADRYVSEITETFLMEDNLLSAIPKEQYMGGNDKYQWKIWVDFGSFDGDNTAAVDPDITAVTTEKDDFLKLETPIREYRKAVEVTDFTQYHSMAAVGDLLGKEINRKSEYVRNSMNADLFKGKTDATAGWLGFNGLIGIADSSTYGTIYNRTRTSANRLLDSTTANTYDSTSEAISIGLMREGYNKVLAHGANAANLAIVMHPKQFEKLLGTQDASIKYNAVPMMAAPVQFGFNIKAVPFLDGIVPIIRDYRCESSSAAQDMFAVVDLSANQGFNLVTSRPLGIRGLAKVGLSEKLVVNFWGCAVYKNVLNVFVHTALTT